ncbi:unnamed protein product [Larinioides sclopetarius]|uniref:Speckle-type POZ protein n=1 Tax=Larinioides sclopetarius TaxID=280406 RepID=A0AAV2BGE6_9ARAC
MAKVLNDEVNKCYLLWKVENISHCWLKMGEHIVSPAFTVDEQEGIKWLMCVYPMGKTDENNVAFYLQRAENCSEPTDMRVSFELSLLDKDGKLLSDVSIGCESFSKNNWILIKSETREKVFISQRETFLPEDTLTVHCAIRYIDEMHVLLKHVSARTVFKVIRRTFTWKFEEFSNVKPGVRNKFKDELIDFEIVLNKGLDFEKKLVLDGILFDDSIKYFSFKTAIVDNEGKNEDLGTHEFFAADLKKGIKSTLLFTKMLIENNSRYLPNNNLSLNFEYVFSTGTVSYQFCSCGMVSPKEAKVPVEERKEYCIEKPTSQLTPMLANDLKSMYNEKICSDTELRILTQTFHAHKNILSARSPVFRRMFSLDMSEEKSAVIDITDLDEDTVHRMLLYMYSDSLEDLEFENACKLLEAAYKYEISSLKSKCSYFLKHNMCSKNVCDIILLAHRHEDEGLKIAAQDFILKLDKEVYGSEEWKKFMETNPKLAGEVMYRKVFLG